MVHGDDFVAIGEPHQLASVEAMLGNKYKIKTETLGHDKGNVQEVKILNKIVRITDAGVELEADPRHAELVVRELGLEGCKPSKAPGSKAVSEKAEARAIKPSKKEELHSIAGEQGMGEMDENLDTDSWESEGHGGVWRRRHSTVRRKLFTPCGLPDSPPRPRQLLGKRVTEGIFTDNNESFIIVDDWRSKRDAHRDLGRDWTGNTTFECGSVRNRSPGTDETGGPASGEDQEQAEGERAMSKPEQGSAWVKRSAGAITDIRTTDPENKDDGNEDVNIDDVNSHWEKIESADEDDDDAILVGQDATNYRSVTARLNYMSPDRVDIQYATKEAARHMATPRASHMAGLKKIGKYLAGRPRLVIHFKWEDRKQLVTGSTDSDWAGCAKTAKSTSGGIIAIGSCDQELQPATANHSIEQRRV